MNAANVGNATRVSCPQLPQKWPGACAPQLRQVSRGGTGNGAADGAGTAAFADAVAACASSATCPEPTIAPVATTEPATRTEPARPADAIVELAPRPELAHHFTDAGYAGSFAARRTDGSLAVCVGDCCPCPSRSWSPMCLKV